MKSSFLAVGLFFALLPLSSITFSQEIESEYHEFEDFILVIPAKCNELYSYEYLETLSSTIDNLRQPNKEIQFYIGEQAFILIKPRKTIAVTESGTNDSN